MALAVETASRCNCMKTHVGAVFLFDGRIRAAGYNGTVEGYKDCFKGGCPRCRDLSVNRAEKLDHCICVHAEENALVAAARHGIPLGKTECYVTHEPCLSCTKLLIQARIKRVVYLLPYEHPGTDQNKSRKSMRDYSKKKKGTKFLRFDQVMKNKAVAVRRAQEWGSRLTQMKTDSLAYGEKYRR